MMVPLWENIFRSDRRAKTLEAALRGNLLFRDLTAREIRLVQQIVNVRTYAPGEPVFQQGEIGVGMYIIVQGSVDVTTEEHARANQAPQNQFITRLSNGDFFGEIALVEEAGRRTATVTAREESVLIGFFKPDLMEIVNRNPGAGVKILLGLSKVLGTRLAETTAMIRSLKLNDRIEA
ncbi:MAG: cyclic nucleotide-binding domain-containing protein [Bdellovibrionaceae bacterium]|nr:cyclic nucleotide-binding domain-containing protein [Pseudobdellovibrionaceae bacterium]